MKSFFPILLILVAGLVFYYLTMPLLDSVNTLRADAATINQALGKARELIAVRDVKRTELNNFPQETRDRLDKFLPDNVDNVRLIIDLVALAHEYGMSLKNPQIVPSQKGSLGPDTNLYDSVDLSFGVTGSYDVFQRFLGDLEKSLRLMDVVAVNFVSGDKTAYDFTFTIRTYWLK